MYDNASYIASLLIYSPQESLDKESRMAKKSPQNALIRPEVLRTDLALARPATAAGDSFISGDTKRAYFTDWKQFFGVESAGQVTLEMCLAVTPERVIRWRDDLIAEGYRPSSVSRKLSSLRALFDHLIHRKAATMNPAHPKLVRSPKRGNVRKMDWLSAPEAKVLLSSIDRSAPQGRRDYAIIMAALHLGLRRSECVGLRMDHFKTDAGRLYVFVRGKGEKERLIAVNRDLEEAFRDYHRDRGDAPGWLFPGRKGPLNPTQFWRIVQGHMEKAGLRKRLGTHGLRASFITINIDKGTPLSEVQKSVGHSRGETTLGYARDLEMIKSRAPVAMEGIRADGPADKKSPKDPGSEGEKGPSAKP